MRPLIIDQSLIALLNGLRENAQANPIDMDEMQRIQKRKALPLYKRPGFSLVTHFGYHILLTVDLPRMGPPVLHLSVYVPGFPSDGDGRQVNMPNPVIVEQIMKLVGFKGTLGKGGIQVVREDAPGETGVWRVIHVLEEMIMS